MSKTTTLHVHHAFLYISLLSIHNYDVKWPNFKFTWEQERQGDKFYHLCMNSGAVPSLQLQSKFPLFKQQGELGKSRKSSKECEVYSSATFSWTSLLSDCKPGFYYRRTLNLRKYPSGHRRIDTVPGTIRRGTVRYIAWLRKNPSGHSTRDTNPKELSIGSRKDKHHTRGTIRRGTWGR